VAEDGAQNLGHKSTRNTKLQLKKRIVIKVGASGFTFIFLAEQLYMVKLTILHEKTSLNCHLFVNQNKI
jgi:hypothetical protein